MEWIYKEKNVGQNPSKITFPITQAGVTVVELDPLPAPPAAENGPAAFPFFADDVAVVIRGTALLARPAPPPAEKGKKKSSAAAAVAVAGEQQQQASAALRTAEVSVGFFVL
jgi:hypothetical protein